MACLVNIYLYVKSRQYCFNTDYRTFLLILNKLILICTNIRCANQL